MNKLLVVDDEEINRLSLEAGFSDLHEIIHAENGKKALRLLDTDDSIEAVLLDMKMPEVNGLDVLIKMNESGLIKKIPVFIITSSNVNEDLLQAYELGAVDVVTKPYNIQFLRRRVENTIELYSQRNNLSKIVDEKTSELIRQNNRLVEAMADIVEFRNNESGVHVKRVSGYTRIIMEGLIKEFSEYKSLADDIQSISFAACLHDLGKIAVPDAVLNKPGKLTPEEFDIMKTHTTYGFDQVKALKDIMDPKIYQYSLDIVRHHHERYDGKGYPDNLSGDKIPIWAQAVALADVYDALSSERCYKKAFSHEDSCQMILSGQCGVFNPKIIQIFNSLKDQFISFKNATSQNTIAAGV